MSTITAIKTAYKGYQFRSRLEARWAIFFDALGEPWEYELEGFELGGSAGRYLPDFFLPDLGMYAEVKPVPLSIEETLKCSSLRDGADSPVLALIGAPGRFWLDGNEQYDGRVFCWAATDSNAGSSDFNFLFSFWGGKLYIGALDHRDRDYCSSNIFTKGERLGSAGSVMCIMGREGIIKAATMARSARFEFGESPTVKRVA